MHTAIDAASSPTGEASGCAYDPVAVERELREAVQPYRTLCEIDLEIANCVLCSGLAPTATQRAMCRLWLVALYAQRRTLFPITNFRSGSAALAEPVRERSPVFSSSTHIEPSAADPSR